MSKMTHLAFLLAITLGFGQSALYNAGNLQLHGNATMGFHTDWINNASFEANSGLVGFYGDNVLQISGDVRPELFDMEIFLPNYLFLLNSLNVNNNLNFVEGNILSALDNDMVYLNFTENAFFTGESDRSKVTGFAAIENQSTFSFPVGDETQLRPLLLNSDSTNELAICAYLFEDPSNPSSLSESYNTESKVRDIGEISTTEFWIIQTNVPSTVTLSWNQRSNLTDLANTVDDLILVGWSKSSQQWIAIGNSAISGDLEQGFLTSEKFVPNDFSAITFGTVPLPTDTFAVNNPSLGNYFLSPNGDGTNDVLIFDELEGASADQLYIFNRFGQKVFEMANYTNQFNGVSNIDNLVVNRDIGLPEGVYYYVVDLIAENLQYQGFLFLDR